MTPATLQALRRLLFYSIEEAAQLLAAGPDHPNGVSPRSWQYWERGDRAIPPDIVDTVTSLCDWRARQIAAAGRGGRALVWYATLDDWMSLSTRRRIHWRPHCAVVAELAARHGAPVVVFDADDYAVWLGRLQDTEERRIAWGNGVALTTD